MKSWNIGDLILTIIVSLIIFYTLDDYYNLLKFDENWCAHTLKLTNKNYTIDKQGSQHGIVFTKFYLCKKYPYIEFKVDIKIPSCGTSHIFLGCLDKTNYSVENLSKRIYFIINLSFIFLERFSKLILLGCLVK